MQRLHLKSCTEVCEPSVGCCRHTDTAQQVVEKPGEGKSCQKQSRCIFGPCCSCICTNACMGLTVTGFNEISLSRRHCLQGTAFSRIEMPFILSESIVNSSFKWIFFQLLCQICSFYPMLLVIQIRNLWKCKDWSIFSLFKSRFSLMVVLNSPSGHGILEVYKACKFKKKRSRSIPGDASFFLILWISWSV